MIFQRRPPSPPKRTIGFVDDDDDVDDIARDISAAQGGSHRDTRPQMPRSGSTDPGPPAFYGVDPRPREPRARDPSETLEDPRDTFSRNAERAAAREEAKRKARAKAEEKAKDAAREVKDGIDYNGDGVIGSGIEGMAGGREMTQQDIINTRINEMLTEDLDTGPARSAMDEALRQASAEARLGARARTGIAGMGLTGAAAAAEGTEARRGERERQMTLDQFDRAARAEELQRLLAGTGELRAGARESREQEAFEKVMALLAEELGSSTPQPDTDGGGEGPWAGGEVMPWNPITEDDSETPVDTGSGFSTDDPIMVDAVPSGAVPVANQEGMYYVVSGEYSDGSPRRKYYRVR